MRKSPSFFLIFVLLSVTNLFTQRTGDIENGKDYPAISRFRGAVIEFYKETKWGSYKLPVSEKGKIDWEKPMSLEGKVTRIQYSVSKENNSEIVMHNYKTGFQKAGYEIMIAISNEELGFSDRPHTWKDKYYVGGGFYNGLNNEKFGLGIEFPNWKNNHSFIAARGHENDKDIYAIVYTVVTDKYTLITQDVIEVEAVETGLVTADNISNDIKMKGHIAIYGIHFDTGKSELKPESAEAVKTIADYLNSHKDKIFVIVGHTDNTGNFEANVKLSRERANSVRKELVDKFKVKKGQLKIYGAGSACPVTNNLTDKGKAKNRRVEVVEL